MPEVPTVDVPMQQKCFIFSSSLPCGHRSMAQMGCLGAWLEDSFYSTSKFLESEFTVGLCTLLNTSSSPYVFHLVQKSQFYVYESQGRWVALLGAEQVLCPVQGNAETALGVLISHQQFPQVASCLE